VVDDYFPVNAQGKPLFAQPAGGSEVWVMILEKCWAKLHKNYGNIVGGLPNEVLHAFSGAPTFYNEISTDKAQQNELWLKMS
jgi:calpain-15